MHFLSICAVVRNEAPYIAEWIEYHLLQGVDHFFLYENGSSDATRNLLESYEHAKVCTLIDMSSDRPVQFTAYKHCIKNYFKKTEWCLFSDCDEFLAGKSAKYILSEIPKNVDAVGVRWKLFGSNGLEERNIYEPVTKAFTKRAARPDKHVKSIVRLKKTRNVGNDPHTFRVVGDICDLKGNVLPREYAITNPPKEVDEPFYLNHYHTKSKKEYFHRKLNNPDPGSGIPYTLERLSEMFRAHDVNEVPDFGAALYADQVKHAIGERFA